MNDRTVPQQHKTTTQIFTPVRGGQLQRKCACGQHTIAGGECAGCHQKRLTLQRRTTNRAEPTTAPPIVHDVLRSPDQSLDLDIRASMGQRFGHDFGGAMPHVRGGTTQLAGLSTPARIGEQVAWAVYEEL